jgi:hypothetical protein
MNNCSYCESIEHTIYNCPIDNELINMFNSENEPKFNEFSVKMLKKLTVLAGIKMSYPKVRILLILKRTWLNNKKKSNSPL